MHASAFSSDMRAFFKVVVIFSLVFLSGIIGRFLAGITAAIAAAYFHTSPQVTTLIVRVLATTFLFGFALLMWVIYSRRRERKSRQGT
jgi:hypothetical protein